MLEIWPLSQWWNSILHGQPQQRGEFSAEHWRELGRQQKTDTTEIYGVRVISSGRCSVYFSSRNVRRATWAPLRSEDRQSHAFADADFGRAPDLFAAPSETIDRAWCTSEDLVREELKKV